MPNDNNDFKRNGSGYYDPTAWAAIRNADRELEMSHERFHKLLNVVLNVCELSGFRLEGRLTVRDKKTGKLWK